MLVKQCVEQGLRTPDFESGCDFSVTFWRNEIEEENVQINTQVENAEIINNQNNINISDTVRRLLLVVGYDAFSPQQIREKLSLRHRTYFLQNYIQPALKLGLIEMTIPDKPNSRLQKYQLMEKGTKLKTNTDRE